MTLIEVGMQLNTCNSGHLDISGKVHVKYLRLEHSTQQGQSIKPV